MLLETERTAVFIDGANFSFQGNAIGRKFNFFEIKRWFDDRCNLVRAYYYSARLQDENGFSHIQPLLDAVFHAGFTMRTKNAKKINKGDGTFQVKGNMDVEMVVDMLTTSEKIEHVCLITGDGDFVYAVEALQKKGVKVSCFGSSISRVVAMDLKKQVDFFFDLDNLRVFEKWFMEQREREINEIRETVSPPEEKTTLETALPVIVPKVDLSKMAFTLPAGSANG